MKIYVPVSLFHEDERLLWILHAVNWQSICKHMDKDAFVPLSSAVLRKVVGRDYTHVLEAAKEKYLDCDNHFLVRRKCRGYRLKPELSRSSWIPITLKDRRLEKRLQKHYDRESQERRERVQGTPYEACVSDLRSVTIEPLDWQAIHFSRKSNKWSSDERKERARLKVQRILDREWYYTRDDYGRFHTNVTSLNNELMPYLRLGGEPVASVDIVNSQPVFLGLYLREIARNLENNKENKEEKKKQEERKREKKEDSITLYKHLSASRSSLLLHQVNTFLGIVCSGEFYETLMGFGGIDRDRAKREYLSYAYGPIRYDNACRRWFLQELPDIAALLSTLKTDGDLSLDKRTRYKCLAREMQRAESKFLFYRVIPRIRQELNTRLLTKHDSVLVPPNLADCAKNIFKEEFSEMGIAANVKIESYVSAADAA